MSVCQFRSKLFRLHHSECSGGGKASALTFGHVQGGVVARYLSVKCTERCLGNNPMIILSPEKKLCVQMHWFLLAAL